VHILHISLYIEPEERNEAWVQNAWERAISIPVVLPVTPRIGDYVEIPFMRMSYSFSTDDKFNYGVVHDVRHTFKGTVIGKQKCSENGKYNAVKMGTGIQ